MFFADTPKLHKCRVAVHEFTQRFLFCLTRSRPGYSGFTPFLLITLSNLATNILDSLLLLLAAGKGKNKECSSVFVVNLGSTSASRPPVLFRVRNSLAKLQNPGEADQAGPSCRSYGYMLTGRPIARSMPLNFGASWLASHIFSSAQ